MSLNTPWFCSKLACQKLNRPKLKKVRKAQTIAKYTSTGHFLTRRALRELFSQPCDGNNSSNNEKSRIDKVRIEPVKKVRVLRKKKKPICRLMRKPQLPPIQEIMESFTCTICNSDCEEQVILLTTFI